MVQWITICLPMQGTWIQSLVQEHSIYCKATKPMNHNYWACSPGACALPATREVTIMRNPRNATRVAPLAPTRESPHAAHRSIAATWRILKHGCTSKSPGRFFKIKERPAAHQKDSNLIGHGCNSGTRIWIPSGTARIVKKEWPQDCS